MNNNCLIAVALLLGVRIECGLVLGKKMDRVEYQISCLDTNGLDLLWGWVTHTSSSFFQGLWGNA